MKVNYAIVCYKQIEENRIQVKHTTLFEEMPDQQDVMTMLDELAMDKQFGMTEDRDFSVVIVGKHEDPEIWQILEIPEEIEDAEETEDVQKDQADTETTEEE